MGPLLRGMRPPVTGELQPVSVHALLSESSWAIGVLAVSSFCFFSRRRWPVFVHEDGSLTERTAARIAALRPAWRIVRRTEADARVNEELGNRPRLKALRARHPLAVKLLDPHVFAPGRRYIFIDSDCLFFARPEFVLRWADETRGEDCWFCREYEGVYAYSMPMEALRNATGCDVLQRVNTGIGLWNKGAMSLDRLEAFLRSVSEFPMTRQQDWYIEQTMSAVMLTDWGRGGLLPKEYATGYDMAPGVRGADCVACHYVGPTKKDRLFYHGFLTLRRCIASERRGDSPPGGREG